MMLWLISPVCLILVFSGHIQPSQTSGLNSISLEPEKTLFNHLLYDKQSTIYVALHLSANSTYEVRVSYPAVVPTDFTIEIIPPQVLSKHKSRHLLNIEKTIFATNDVTEGYLIKVTAYRVGFPLNEERLKDPVVYNIVLERLYAGLSTNSWKLVGCGCLILLVTFKYLIPFAHNYIISIIEKHEHVS